MLFLVFILIIYFERLIVIRSMYYLWCEGEKLNWIGEGSSLRLFFKMVFILVKGKDMYFEVG